MNETELHLAELEARLAALEQAVMSTKVAALEAAQKPAPVRRR